MPPHFIQGIKLIMNTVRHIRASSISNDSYCGSQNRSFYIFSSFIDASRAMAILQSHTHPDLSMSILVLTERFCEVETGEFDQSSDQRCRIRGLFESVYYFSEVAWPRYCVNRRLMWWNGGTAKLANLGDNIAEYVMWGMGTLPPPKSIVIYLFVVLKNKG